MNTKEFAKIKRCDKRTVSRAIREGLIPAAAVRWSTRGKRRTVEIVDVELAAKSWEPELRGPPEDSQAEPGQLSDSASASEARRVFEIARARQAKLEHEIAAGKLIAVETAKAVFGKQITEAKTMLLAVPNKARSRIPHLSVDDVVVIEDLIREALEDLAAGGDRSRRGGGRS